MIVGVNLKVMFSFMVAHRDFDRVDSRRCDFLLWRDPFERTVSTFFDKCRQAAKDGAKVQNSQQLVLEALGLNAPPDLQRVSFEEFVSVLPSIYMADAHFRPQLNGLRPGQVGSVIDIATDLDALGRRLGIDFSLKVNQTERDEAGTYQTAGTRRIIEALYAIDFKAPRYRSRSPIARWFSRSW